MHIVYLLKNQGFLKCQISVTLYTVQHKTHLHSNHQLFNTYALLNKYANAKYFSSSDY